MSEPQGAKRPLAEPPSDPTLLQTAASAAAAMFGVQSSKNRKRDFKSSSPVRFIIMGAVMTAVFILCVLLAVRYVMLHSPAEPY